MRRRSKIEFSENRIVAFLVSGDENCDEDVVGKYVNLWIITSKCSKIFRFKYSKFKTNQRM